MNRRIAMTGLAGAAAALLGLGLPLQSAIAAPAPHLLHLALAIPANSTSTAQAGYAVTTVPASSSAFAKFKVPAITGCTGTTTVTGISTGVFDFSSTSGTFASVFVVCNAGTPLYQATVFVNGVQTAATWVPAPGNLISVSVSMSATASRATVKDITLNKSLSKSATAGATPAAVIDGMDALVSGTTQLPVPNFGKIAFSAGKIDGVTPKAAAAFAVDMKTSGGILQIHTGTLNVAGNGWSEFFKHA